MTANVVTEWSVLIAHLSDLHLRDNTGDLDALARQLARIRERQVQHLAITGDVIDRWNPRLLDKVLDLLAAHDLLHADRTTIIHGNHDFASSGGHPRTRADLWRLAFRFWDPPPVVIRRRHRFYRMIEKRASGVAAAAPSAKTIAAGARIAFLDSVPVPWKPLTYHAAHRSVALRHAIGCLRRAQVEWLAQQRGSPLIVLVHHYPAAVGEFTWRSKRLLVRVPMEIPAEDRALFWRAAREANATLVLCGHVHRARLERHHGIALGLNGQSGADWAGRTIAFYEVTDNTVSVTHEPR